MRTFVDRIQHFAETKPSAAALIWNGDVQTYQALYGRVSAARDHLIARDLPREGAGVVTLENLATAWPWIMALQSLGVSTIATPNAGQALALDVGSIVCIVGDIVDGDRIPLQIDLSTAEAVLVVDPMKATAPFTSTATASHFLLSSGTTGLPKIVRFSPEAERAAENVESFRYDENAVVYAGRFPLFTGVGYRIPLRAWSAGATVVLEQGSNPWRPFRTGRLTHATLTPGMLEELLTLYPQESSRNDSMWLMIAGGQAKWSLVEAAKTRLSQDVWAGYGATESGLISSTPLHSEDDTRLYVIDEGRDVDIVNDAGFPVPPGTMGLVRVDTRAGIEEYWRDPATTSIFFRHGWFYSGDLGRFTEDGRLELMGRATDILDLKGDKRSPQIYESRVRHAVAISDVCIMQVGVGASLERLHVFYENPQPLTPDEHGRMVAQLPKGFELVLHHRRLPRNAMGKIMRAALRAELAAAIPVS